MDPLEASAALLIVLNVALLARRSVWNYPIAIAGVGLYALIFWRARLYSDAGLQVVFVLLNLYGWVTWARARAREGEIRVRRLTSRGRALWAGGCAVVTFFWGWGMHAWTDAAAPWVDGGIAVVSLAAQWLLARRKLDNWDLWIGVDLVAAPLYAWRGLWVTALLYTMLLAISVLGRRDWRRAMEAHR